MYYDIVTSEKIDFLTLMLNLEERINMLFNNIVPILVEMLLELEI